ncbi:unnamed protein product [Owenia fusiformis]|uniref:non-specific serine/threonine protein kinase n=1 Tax=Owenia fusiformis TaxID=6347 RepID=A0A8S4NZW4_OWEFU|nr:unnamed protein product [Owenia fusiformis]
MSTSSLSIGSFHDYLEENVEEVNTTPKKRKRHTPPSTPDGPPADVEEDIEKLYNYIPEVEEIFTVLDKVGEGTFSSVYLARLKKHPEVDQYFALKHIIPTSHPSRTENELRCLQQLRGVNNVIGVQWCVRHKDHVVIVMPYFQHGRFQDGVKLFSVAEVREYMRNLLISLKQVHKFDIIHRDVKPSNFLVDRKLKRYALVDFGLAHKAPVQLKPQTSASMVPQKPTHASIVASSPTKRKTRAQTENLGVQVSSLKRSSSLAAPLRLNKLTVNEIKADALKNATAQVRIEKLKMSQTPTPDIMKPEFRKKMKSPRRVLMCKRMLHAQKKDELILRKLNNSSSTSHKPNPARTALYDAPTTCKCFGLPQVCNICTARGAQVAPRAGTPGFRAPEVLMKSPDQTTAVDIWSAGVMFLSLLSGRYPFFRAPDDMTALAQIIALMGSNQVKEAAKHIGKDIICHPTVPALDLKILCEKLRNSTTQTKPKTKSMDKENPVKSKNSWDNVPQDAYDLLYKLLDLNPHTRITAESALEHPFFHS